MRPFVSDHDGIKKAIFMFLRYTTRKLDKIHNTKQLLLDMEQ
jgi:hypothetical protein